jgi:hypothetical protein
MPDPADILAIQQLIALYGHIIDEREWHRVDELFTEDAVYDLTEFGLGIVNGAQAIRTLWSRPDAMHPLAHHATDPVITQDPDGTVRVLSKAIGFGGSGRIGSVVYRDVVRRTPGGWRFAARTVRLRR